MPEKKKISAAKSVDSRVGKSPVSKPVKSSDGAHASSVTAAHPSAPNAEKQLATFEAAMKYFHARKLREARELFLEAAKGPECDVANRAALHTAMCDRRLQQAPVHLGSAEDYYNYGVALLNQRNAHEARSHLEKALQLSPGADHVYYALASAQAMAGDFSAAYENLRRAIELEPRNRIIARQDADFAHFANQPPFDSLLYPEKKLW